MTITTEIIEVTPKMAEDFLGKNTHNRTLRSRSVSAMAADMRNDNWQLNGEAIKFDLSGMLLDGQHRLNAVIASGATVTMLIIRGLEPDTQTTIDTGTKRTFADVLKLNNVVDANNIAATVRLHYLYRVGSLMKGLAPTHTQLAEHYEMNADAFRDAVTQSGSIARNTSGPRTTLGVLAAEVFTLSEYADDWENFASKMKSGADLSTGNPILTYRNWAINYKHAQNKPPMHVSLAIVIKAWNGYVLGTPVHVLAYKGGGATPEKFPVIR